MGLNIILAPHEPIVNENDIPFLLRSLAGNKPDTYFASHEDVYLDNGFGLAFFTS